MGKQSIFGVSGKPMELFGREKNCIAICVEDYSGNLKCVKFFTSVLMSFVKDNVSNGDIVCIDCAKREGNITFIGRDIKIIKKEKILDTYEEFGELHGKDIICCSVTNCNTV